MTRRVVVGLSLVVFALGCSRSQPVAGPNEENVVASTWRTVAEADLTTVQRAQLDRALAAKDELATTLMGELKTELEIGGPSGAVVVCRDMAPLISEHVADNHGLSIGRTSHRLRNPGNLAPGWAAPAVNEIVDTAWFAEGPAGELGAILPIRLASALSRLSRTGRWPQRGCPVGPCRELPRRPGHRLRRRRSQRVVLDRGARGRIVSCKSCPRFPGTR